MKTYILLATLIYSLAFSAMASTTQIEHFQVKQDDIKIVIAENSGLPMALCEFKDSKGYRVVRQIVTVAETYDNIVIIETRLYNDQSYKIQSVVCEA